MTEDTPPSSSDEVLRARVEAQQESIAQLQRSSDRAYDWIEGYGKTIRGLIEQGATTAVIAAKAEELSVKALDQIDGPPHLDTIRDRVKTMPPNRNSDDWSDNVAGGFRAMLGSKPGQVVVVALATVVILLAFAVVLLVYKSDDPLNALTRQQVEAQQQTADGIKQAAESAEQELVQEKRQADALEEMVDEGEDLEGH